MSREIRHLRLRTLELQRLATPGPRDEARVDGRALWRSPPSLPVRQYERLLVKTGRLQWETSHATALARALRAASPRFLVRIDEFPHYQSRDDPDAFGTTFMREFMSALGDLPRLVAIVPRPAVQALDPEGSDSTGLQPDEVAFLGELGAAGCAFGLHGLTHRTRRAHPRRHSELSGLSPSQLRDLLDEADELLGKLGVETRVFVPPFNRFERRQYDILAERFDVVCGGPESIANMGFLPGPSWQGDAVYLPSYAPLYGAAGDVAQAARRLIEREVPGWMPIVLHPGWERADEFEGVRTLVTTIADHTATWDEFLGAVDASRSTG